MIKKTAKKDFVKLNIIMYQIPQGRKAKFPRLFRCSVILGELTSFRNYKGLSFIIPKILNTMKRITKVRIFLIPLFITFLNPKTLGCLFDEK